MTNQPKLQQQVLRCDCSSQDHWLIVERDDWDAEPNLIIYTQLSHWSSWFKRLWWAIKYLIGKAQKYGHWDSTTIHIDSAIELRNILNEYIDDKNTWAASAGD
jgi:hypothetical protein